MSIKAIKEQLLKWMCEKHATNSYFDRDLLREKAFKLARKRGLNDFKCSESWLTHFVKEHGFSADLTNRIGPMFTNYRDWIDLMRSTITKYKYNDLFHADELTMYSDTLPSRIISDEFEDPRDIESPRKRINILMCCNSSGTTKLPLLICGPYPSKITVKEHVYCHSENSYIGDELFRNWLSNVNDRMSRSNRKILLFLRRNRAGALNGFNPSNVKLIYLPDDFPSVLRPLRRDVFHYVKMILRRRYVERLQRYTEEWNLRDILASLIDAWETIPRELIVFSFQRTHFRTDDCFLQISCDCWENLKLNMSFNRFVTFDDYLSDQQPINSNQYHIYNFRRNCRNVANINENTLDSGTVEKREETLETKSRELYSKSDRDYLPLPLKLKNRADQKLGRVTIKSHNETRNDRQRGGGRSRTPIDKNGDRRRSQKRAYSEIQFSTKGKSGNRRRSRDRNIKDSFVSQHPNVSPSKSIRGEAYKEEALQRDQTEVNNTTESFQTIIDKALTVASPEKADHANKLIDGIYAYDQRIENANDQEHFQSLNEELDEESVTEISYANQEAPLLKCINNVDSSVENISTNLAFNLSRESNPPSTSTKNANPLSVEIVQSAADTGNRMLSYHDRSQVTNSTRNLSDGNKSSNIRQEVSNVFKKKRRKSSDLNDSEDDSLNSEPIEKQSKLDHDWSKQFETTFVFGSLNTVFNSLGLQSDGNIVDTCIFDVKPSISPRN